MRDILTDLESGPEPDPIRRAQSAMKRPLPKRFYKQVAVAAGGEGFVVQLDGRGVRTPGHALLVLPTLPAAQLVADEFAAQGDEIDPATMPAYRLANTAIDGVATDGQAVIEDIMRFASSDMVCYRAGAPDALVERQSQLWDPVLDWARAEIGARFHLAEGVMHVEQPRESIALVGARLRQNADPLRLAALHLMTSISGSALIALAREAAALSFEEAWAAAHADEDWNISQWGEDFEAAKRRENRRRDMAAADAMLAALTAVEA